ncbi:adenylyltransferase/cytidyltransferase family protein [Streptomyces sp. WMMC500]|uniref:adenylyltransferase/cytidyltransferase family protein n=1 Tax=Streptomyces sp. WMMC500 TaxID=3015154 RepID=UPI00248AE853|nr:adenylyltransferase/cytidyltransferase family protein [Streptomyces sp. WMMC500]WBB59734.1 adenylyltransferase/cytidyltransferase family protein [Streptomyces sp. WMMC500]
MAHTVGYAPGVYDLFHVGHLNILRHARSRCDYLVAGVVSDEMARLAKGRAPVVPLVERLEIVRSIRHVDAAFVETVPDKLETWQQVRFDVIFKGDDWRGTPKGEKLEADFRTVGVEVVYFPYTVHTSSTQLRRALDTLADRGPHAPRGSRGDAPVSSPQTAPGTISP